jgi:5-methylcytosine-specific restriction protein A
MRNIKGLTKKVDPFYLSKEWKNLRLAILQRENYTCRTCGRREPAGMQVDHIMDRKSHPHLALVPGNLRVLCRPCHTRASTSMGRNGKYRERKFTKVGSDGFPSDDWR